MTVLFEGLPVAHHPLLGPGECSIEDAHYPSPPPTGTRPLRPRSEPERAFLALGEEAERYLRMAPRRGRQGCTSGSTRRSARRQPR